MRKIKILLSLCALCALLPVAAQTDASTALRRLREAVAARSGYAVRFDVETSDGFAGSGRYAVEGESYYLEMGRARVFCDGEVRCEVDDDLREVTLDRVAGEAGNLLDDPVHAFDFLDTRYAAELLSADDGQVVLRLVPRDRGAVDSILLDIDAQRWLPRRVVYEADGLRVTVAIRSFEESKEPLLRFDRAHFADYEVIDFR